MIDHAAAARQSFVSAARWAFVAGLSLGIVIGAVGITLLRNLWR